MTNDERLPDASRAVEHVRDTLPPCPYCGEPFVLKSADADLRQWDDYSTMMVRYTTLGYTQSLECAQGHRISRYVPRGGRA